MQMNKVPKIAILFHADLNNRRGQTNAVLSRIKYLKRHVSDKFVVDVICMSYFYGSFIRCLFHKPRIERNETCTIDNTDIRIIWRKFYVVDYILKFLLHKSPFFAKLKARTIIRRSKQFNLISAHSFLGGEIALEVYKKYKIPYCITWHGTDIHTMPFESDYLFATTKAIIENAAANFFVSASLLEKSNEITKVGHKMVLYNGYSTDFRKFTTEEKNILRETNALSAKNKIVAFVGNLIPIKNASLLPSIFQNIKDGIKSDVEFWIIGDGLLRETIESNISSLGIAPIVKLFGNVPHDQMPGLMNCIDLLILPSINEGLPLVTVEALMCGAMVVGSDVGGISEAIGIDNVVRPGDDFVARFVKKCIDSLQGKYTYSYNNELDWKKTALKEITAYSKILTAE